MMVAASVFSQSEQKSSISSEWEAISLGKLQKKPRFKEPMISVRFIAEDGVRYLNLSLKYMFTDAVFDEAVPVEYYKNEKIEFSTDKDKYELKAAKYAKARRMNSVAQKTADIRVVFSGDLSFLKDDLVKTFTVHYAQGYQNIDLNKEEAIHLRDNYNKFLAMLPVVKQAAPSKVKIEGVAATPAKAVVDTLENRENSLDKLRKQAKKWRK